MFFISKLSDSPSSDYSIRPIDMKAAELGNNAPTFPLEYQEFADMFSGEKVNTLPPHRPYNLQINTEGDAKPFYEPIYSLSPLELTALCEFLEESTWNGFIHPSRSPWGSPILFVKKKDGSLHLCVDYRALNKVTQKDQYPLPLITDLLDSLGLGRIYTKIDLKHAYHLVRIAEGNEPKMAFQTRYSSFEWTVMLFGLSNAPAAFQCLINEVLGDLWDICTIGYLDGILIYSDSLDEHQIHVSEILCCLRNAGLYANPKKSIFHMNMVEYLGLSQSV